MKKHPAERYSAPNSIETGVPLKTLLDRKLVKLIGESLAEVTEINEKQFLSKATRGLKNLELKDRAIHIAGAMMEQLPDDFAEATPILIESLGPCLEKTEDNGLSGFFYFPHTMLIAHHGVNHFDAGMQANYEITKRFTAEFSIRPFLIEHRVQCLKLLKTWLKDPDPHVRRLVSEGTRPRLPWAMRLPEFQEQPKLVTPFLEKLKDDSELYVRRSVANHLGDIAKDNPEVTFAICEKWIKELKKSKDPTKVKNRHWMIRHAVRHPAKKGVKEAVKLRKAAK